MNQICTFPLVSFQRMSLLPSPLKSPVSAIDQLFGICTNGPVCATVAPFISQIDVFPAESRQRMSLLPSPLKSPVLTTVVVAHTPPARARARTCDQAACAARFCGRSGACASRLRCL